MAMERARERRLVPILLLLSKRMKTEGDGSFMCNSTDHWAKNCPHCKGRTPSPKYNTVNMECQSGNQWVQQFTLYFQCLNLLVDVLILVQLFTFVLVQVQFLHTRLLMFFHDDGKWFACSIHGIGMVDLRLTSGKVVQVRKLFHVPTSQWSLLPRDDFKVALEANKFFVFKYGQCIGKGYEYRGMFCFLFFDFYNKLVILFLTLHHEFNYIFFQFQRF